jgi:hypothetical protein
MLHRHLNTVIAISLFASLSACASSGRQSGGTEVSVAWDSGPLDRDYNREHSEMTARHSQEAASPRPDESADARNQRQASERQDLEVRYTQGKAAHAQALPAFKR